MSKIVAIGGSAGSTHVLKTIVQGLPADFPAAILIVSHIGARASMLPELLQQGTSLPVRHAVQGEPIVAGRILVAPPDLHLTLTLDAGRAYARLTRGPKENHSRPAIDPLFRSAAMAYGADAIGVVLSGFLDDGTVGLQAIKACGGMTLVQDPADAEAPDMPASAMRYTEVDAVCRADEIARTLVALATRPRPPARPPTTTRSELPDVIAVENRMFNEDGTMTDLDRIGVRVALTCPECGGAIWKINGGGPLRYRCHTGHAFTARVLASMQGDEVEEALWAAVRALHEQEQLFRQLYEKTQARANTTVNADPAEYLDKANQAKDHAQLLRDLIVTRMHITPVHP